ncbi:hypothetical protein ABK040_015180 [Willaertia magna]
MIASSIKRVCFSAFTSEERKELAECALKLGLQVDSNFEYNTNVLIADRVGTEKYRSAVNISIPIVRKEWLLDSLSKNKILDTDKYLLPALYGCKISVSGYKEEIRKKVKQLCETNGAHYNPDLIAGYTHLITKKKGSDKFNFALQNNMNIVTYAWIEDSVKKGYAEDECKYFLEDLTPDELVKCREISNRFQGRGFGTDSFSEQSEPLSNSSMVQQTQPKNIPEPNADDLTSTTTLTQPQIDDSDILIMQGMTIYLLGFSRLEEKMARKLIRDNGGIVCPHYDSRISVFIIGDTIPDERILKKLNYDAIIVKYDWVKECIVRGEIQPFDPYLYGKTPVQKVNNNNIKSNVNEVSATFEEITDEMVAQLESQKSTKKESAELSGKPQLVFSNMTFALNIYQTHKAIATGIIENNGGKLTKKSNYDFIIYQDTCKTPRSLDPKIRTLSWLEDCAKYKTIKQPEESIIYKPTFRLDMDSIKPKGDHPLIVLSGFNEEKGVLKKIITALEAKTVKDLKKDADVLVCKGPSEKYNFALRNNIPVVTEHWLYDSYKHGYFVALENYKFEAQSTSTSKLIDSYDTQSTRDSTESNSPFVTDRKIVLDKIVVDESTRDIISPEKANPIQSGFSSMVAQLLNKPNNDEEETSNVNLLNDDSFENDFVSKKKLENFTVFSTQTYVNNYVTESDKYTAMNDYDFEYNEKIKKDRMNSFAVINRPPISATLYAETQIVNYDTTTEKQKFKEKLLKAHTEKDRHFLLTSCSTDIKSYITKKILQLGAQIDENYIPGVTTHLIVEKPIKTEKFVCSVVSGSYILKPQYIKESADKGMWVDEEDYQWRNDEMTRRSNPEYLEGLDLCDVAINIRESNHIFFAGFVAYIPSMNNRNSFKNILEAGGAKVLDTLTEGVTHIFIETISMDLNSSLECLKINKKYKPKFINSEDIINMLPSGYSKTYEIDIEAWVKKRKEQEPNPQEQQETTTVKKRKKKT